MNLERDSTQTIMPIMSSFARFTAQLPRKKELLVFGQLNQIFYLYFCVNIYVLRFPSYLLYQWRVWNTMPAWIFGALVYCAMSFSTVSHPLKQRSTRIHIEGENANLGTNTNSYMDQASLECRNSL